MEEKEKREIIRGKKEKLRNEGGGSEGSMKLEELWKRKREVTGGEETEGEREEDWCAFKKGKRVQRSPQRKEDRKGQEEEERREREEGREEGRREMMEGLREIKEEIKEVVRSQGREIREELETIRKQMREREEVWRREREEMKDRIDELERRMEREQGMEKKGRVEKGGEGNKFEDRIREMEKRIEKREREERRKNVWVKGLRGGEKEIEERVKEIWGEIGAGKEIEQIKVSEGRRGGEGGRVLVRMRSIEGKRVVMRKRREIGGKEIRVEDDLTWKERKMRWMIEEIARKERERGKRVWVGYGKIQIEGKWWWWDEEESKLRNKGGKIRDEEGEGERGEGDRGGKTVEDEDREEKGGGIWRVAFWNVAGIRNKNGEFWRKVREWDVVVLMETWVEEKGWQRMEGKLPREYDWKVSWAKRESGKGRASGGMLMGVRKGIEREEEEEKEDGIIKSIVRIGGERWRVIGVYVNKDIEKKMEGLKKWMEEGEEGIKTIIGGDFNARTGEEGGGRVGEGREEEERSRRSKDKRVNKEGRKMIRVLEERGWIILNGNVKGDEEGEFTYVGGRGETVIDYILGDREVKERVVRLEVGEEVESDHHSIGIWLEGGGGKREEWRERRKRKVNRGRWDKEGKERFKKEIGSIDTDWGGIEEELKEMGGKIRGALKKSEEEGRGEERKGGGWWDEECREEKRRVRKELRKWRRGEGSGEEYRKRKKEYKKMCEKKKKEERERIEREVEGARTEGKVWEIVNKERKRRGRVNENIEMEEWKEYFMRLMGGIEGRVRRGSEGRKGGEEEKEMGREEVKKAIREMKEGKAMGKDEIPNEVWKYGGEEVEKWGWEVCRRVWKGEGWPEEWNEGVVVPIMKKGKGEKVTDYRGITLMPSLYKIYATVLAGRIREEIEEKRGLSGSQAGFRKGMGTMDQIYALNYFINRQLGRKKKEMAVLFVDFKAAFDTVDRGKLIGAMRERGIREGLVVRVEELMRETKSRVRVGEEMGGEFWTARGLRQGCPLSPILINILIADLEEEMARGGWGGIRLGEGKIYTLSYADDVVLMAEEGKEMGTMIARLEKYVERKRLEVNVEKTKVMRFRKGGGRRKKMEWRWKGKKLEEVKEYRYLGYVIQANGGQEAHIRERKKKAAIVMREVWGIGKRVWGKDWKRRIWLYDKLVWTVMGYGMEIWGWRERREVEGVHERYLRWTMGMDWRTPGYMIREELGREKMRGGTRRKAWKFEERLEEGKGGEVARKCWEEMKKRWSRGKVVGGWEKEREECMKDWRVGEEEGGRMELEIEKVMEREKEKQREERWERIRKAKCSRWYGRVKGKGVPKYLEKGWAEERWRRIMRFRMGNEMREGWYWEGEEKRKCRICGEREETWEHVWEECGRGDGGKGRYWQEVVEKILGEEGEGEEWMREIERIRRSVERGGAVEGGGVEVRERESEREMEEVEEMKETEGPKGVG